MRIYNTFPKTLCKSSQIPLPSPWSALILRCKVSNYLKCRRNFLNWVIHMGFISWPTIDKLTWWHIWIGESDNRVVSFEIFTGLGLPWFTVVIRQVKQHVTSTSDMLSKSETCKRGVISTMPNKHRNLVQNTKHVNKLGLSAQLVTRAKTICGYQTTTIGSQKVHWAEPNEWLIIKVQKRESSMAV